MDSPIADTCTSLNFCSAVSMNDSMEESSVVTYVSYMSSRIHCSYTLYVKGKIVCVGIVYMFISHISMKICSISLLLYHTISQGMYAFIEVQLKK